MTASLSDSLPPWDIPVEPGIYPNMYNTCKYTLYSVQSKQDSYKYKYYIGIIDSLIAWFLKRIFQHFISNNYDCTSHEDAMKNI